MTSASSLGRVAVALAAACVATASVAASACGAAGPRYARLVHLYDYDRNVPLDAREASSSTQDGIRTLDISYRSPLLGRVTGYLVLPAGRGPFPAIVWMGGLDGRKDDMLAEALDLAHSGAAGLLLDAAVARPPYPSLFRYSTAERRTWIRNIVDIRRGIDYLATRPDVDMSRLGYVGFSFGADTGAILASVDHRFKAVVVASGGATQLDMLKPGGFFYRRVPAAKRAAYVEAAIAPFEPVRYVAHLAPAAVFFQHGKTDPSFTRANQRLLDRMASSPKKAAYYDAGHELDFRAVQDRKTWLRQELGLM